MATTRIKDLSKTATTVNSDANLVLDGNTGGTQKITRDNFRQDTADAFVAAPGTYNLAPINSGTGKIDATYLPTSSDTPKGAWNASTNTPTLADGSGTAGDYYDVTVAGSSDLGSGSITFTVGDVVKYNGTTWFKIDSVTNILDGVSTIDGAKAAIEIPDVGTAPNEVPLNGQLGSMAFQDSAGVSVGQLEVTDKLGVGVNPSGNPLEVAGTNGNFSIAADGNTANFSRNAANYIAATADTSSSLAVLAQHSFQVHTGASTTERLRVDSGGNLILQKGGGAYVQLKDASAVRGAINVGTSDGLIFTTGASFTERWRINASGNLVGSGGQILYNDGDCLFVGDAGNLNWDRSTSTLVLGSGAAIDFGTTTTGSGSVATNGGLLADYEFGDFTVTAGGTWTSAPTSLAGKYIKVGNQVTVFVVFHGGTKAGSTIGWLEGLPFATNVWPGQGSVSDTGVTDRGVCYAANTDRLWLTGTSFGATNYATVSYRHD